MENERRKIYFETVGPRRKEKREEKSKEIWHYLYRDQDKKMCYTSRGEDFSSRNHSLHRCMSFIDGEVSNQCKTCIRKRELGCVIALL